MYINKTFSTLTINTSVLVFKKSQFSIFEIVLNITSTIEYNILVGKIPIQMLCDCDDFYRYYNDKANNELLIIIVVCIIHL